MTKILLFLVITLICLIVNTRSQAAEKNKPINGHTFDEIVVSSDLNVRRKSKENRQGKKLLTNAPLESTSLPGKPSPVASRLISSDGSRVTPEKREKRGIMSPQEKALNLGNALYFLKSRGR